MNDVADFTQELAKQAGAILLGYADQALVKDMKEDSTFATQADKETEAFMIKTIQAAFPEDAILGEETGLHAVADAQHTWIIDPLDGTSNFFKKSPDYGVMIARATGDEVDLGCLFFPAQNKLLFASCGQGAWLNGQKLQVKLPTKLVGYAVASGSPLNQPGEVELKKLEGYLRELKIDLYSLRASCSNALAMIEGTHSAFVINMNYTWDNAAPGFILQEAGFSVTDWEGQPIRWKKMQQHLLACPPALKTIFMEKLH